jgi:uncharacterized Zn finger protein
MSRYEMAWAPYVPVAERRRKAEKLAAKLRKQGRQLAPVVIEGRAMATTFWGKAWCGNLEAYRDYESRLPRGRSYVRNGAVIDLQIAPGDVHALVIGSELYKTRVSIRPLSRPAWRRLCADCAGRIDSLVELLQGRFSKAVMERLCRQDAGLFPRPAEIRFDCSCPDHAALCKHVAAVLYGVGARLDQQPDLLFRLRAVDGAELVAGATADLPLVAGAPAADRVLQEDDMAALFGLDMASPAEPAVSNTKRSVIRPPGGRAGAPAAMPPPAPRAATETAKGARAGAAAAASGGAKSGKGIAAVASGGGSSGTAAGTMAGPATARPARKARKPASPGLVPSPGARAVVPPKAAGGKAAPRAQPTEPASKPTTAAKAGSATPKVRSQRVSKVPSVTGMSAAMRPAAARDRARWSWKARAAARKAKNTLDRSRTVKRGRRFSEH